MDISSTVFKSIGEIDGRLSDLLTDEIYVDFFNTFINLPVLGQTPLLFHTANKWFTCPDIGQLQVNRGGFLRWLTAHRLPLLKETELFNCYTLCKELLDFSKHHSKDLPKWTTADQWLLKRCIGSVRGMRRFFTFTQSSRGEDLVPFCVQVSSLLLLDAEDPSQRHRYLAQLTSIRELHLREGSSVMAACHIPTDVAVSVLSNGQPDGARKRLLAQMRAKALRRLRRYWLPRFLRSCKTAVQSVAECGRVARQYAALVSSRPAADLTSAPRDADLGEEEEEEQEEEGMKLQPGIATVAYCSKRTKKLLCGGPRARQSTATPAQESLEGLSYCQWLPLGGATDQDGCTSVAHHQTERRAIKTVGAVAKMSDRKSECRGDRAREADAPPLAGIATPRQEEEVVVPHACVKTPAFYFPSTQTVPAPPAELHCYRYMRPALSADRLAGGPFCAFLRERGLAAQLRQLALWQELELYLSLALRAQGSDALYWQRQAVGRRITQTYLSDGTQTRVRLEAVTSVHLCRLLPSGAVIPWIYKARYEICQVLCVSYDEFLDAEDKHFRSFVFDHEQSDDENCGQILTSSGHNTAEQQRRRMREALALCQACCSHGGDTATPSEESWAQMALEDVGRGGSVHLQYTKTDPFDLPFELLASRYPKLAAERLSVNFLLYCKRKPLSEGASAKTVAGGAMMNKMPSMAKKASLVRRPSMRPRSFADVLRTPVSLGYFKHFLRSHNAHGALLYVQEVEKLRGLCEPKPQMIKILAIVDRFFRRHDSMDFLQCNADIISQVPQMRPVTCEVLYKVQDLVSKSLEGTWFQEYQNSFPTVPTVSDDGQRRVMLKNKLMGDRAWSVFYRFIKSVCGFRRAMKDLSMRSAFEMYLRQGYLHFSVACASAPKNQQHPESPVPLEEEGDASPMRARVINNSVLLVDFLTNDLSFYLESERFRGLADAGTMMASAGMYGENDHVMLHQKADMIIKLFLKSEISPKLRINIAESQREAILQQFSIGKVDRGLFHPAIITIVPNLIFCWKKYCCQKAMKKPYGDKALKKQEASFSPDYMDPLRIDNDWYSKVKTFPSAVDGHTTLCFSIHHGLKLTVPRVRLGELSDEMPAKVPSRHRSVSKVPSPHRSMSSFSLSSSRSFEAELQLKSSQLPHPEGVITPDGSSLSALSEEH